MFRCIKGNSLKKILILETNQKNFDTLDNIFINENFSCTAVLDKKTLDALDTKTFDLILVNSHIKYISVKDLSTLTHAELAFQVPILYIDNTKDHDRKHLQECFEHGACDYLKKPFDKAEVLVRVLFHFHQFQKVKKYKLRIDRLARLATVDQLSKSSSKMHMNAILKHEINNYKRYKRDTTVVYMSLLNVDKTVSVFGLETGAKLVSAFTKELKTTLRKSDVLARWVGSEFIILLTNIDAKTSHIITQKINKSLAAVDILKGIKPILAFGIMQLTQEDTIEELISRAKYALKEAKKQTYGRIAVV